MTLYTFKNKNFPLPCFSQREIFVSVAPSIFRKYFVGKKSCKLKESLTAGRVWPGLGPWSPGGGRGYTGLFYSAVPLPRCCCCCYCCCWDWGAPSGGRRTHRPDGMKKETSEYIFSEHKEITFKTLKYHSKLDNSCVSSYLLLHKACKPQRNTAKCWEIESNPAKDRWLCGCCGKWYHTALMSALTNTAFWGEYGASWLPSPYREKGPLCFLHVG